MVWIINSVPKVQQVALGSKEMMAATCVYDTAESARSALQEICKHETVLGHSGTGRTFCADCSKPFN